MLDRESLLGELDQVRRDGFAVNNEELAYGLRSIAAPARDQTGTAVAAINLAVHRSIVSLDDLVHGLSPPLLRATGDISRRIGYRSGPDVAPVVTANQVT